MYDMLYIEYNILYSIIEGIYTLAIILVYIRIPNNILSPPEFSF